MTPELIEHSRKYRDFQSKTFYNNLTSYREMMADDRRNTFYISMLTDVKDKVVLDIGAGIGALSLAALGAGASKVYAVEMNPEAVKFLEDMKAEKNLDNLIIINSSSWDLKLPEKVDFIVHEIFGSFLLDELCLITLDDVKKHLKPGGKVLPEEFGFVFKPYSLETQVGSVKTINGISDFYSKLNKGQIVVEDVITDDIKDHIIEFGPFEFTNYTTEELENSLNVKRELTMDSLWVIPYVKYKDQRMYLCKQSHDHHWGNSFLAFGKYVTLEPGTTIELKFWIDPNLTSFNTGLSLV